jgi:Calx-beta domain
MNYYTYEWAIVDISAPPSTPSISVSDAPTVYETPLGTVAVFTVTLSSASQDTITVQYDTQDGSAHAQADYQAKTGTLTFMPGQPTTATISVPISKC